MPNLSLLTESDRNDLFLDGDNIAISDGALGLSNICTNTALVLQGELQFDTTYGTPFLSDVFVSSPDISIIENFIETAILNVTDVLYKISIQSTFSNETLSYQMQLMTNIGEITING